MASKTIEYGYACFKLNFDKEFKHSEDFEAKKSFFLKHSPNAGDYFRKAAVDGRADILRALVANCPNLDCLKRDLDGYAAIHHAIYLFETFVEEDDANRQETLEFLAWVADTTQMEKSLTKETLETDRRCFTLSSFAVVEFRLLKFC